MKKKKKERSFGLLRLLLQEEGLTSSLKGEVSHNFLALTET